MDFQRCTRCIMDNRSDDKITFDSLGRCNYCTDNLELIGKVYFPNKEGKKRLDKMLAEIRESTRGGKYDCIMGLSGGLDSSYLAYLAYKWGLRVLAVHVDDGYDTEISKSNLKKLIAATKFDYEVITPDAKQYNALTFAFMKAGVPNLAIPQDNICLAFIHKKMREYGIKYFLSGTNFALECILQKGNTHSNSDVVNIKDINKRFGTEGIDKLEFISTTKRAFDRELYRLKTERPLNYVDYNRDRAFTELNDFCGFQYYGRKHLENILTAFVQLVWFPQRFNVDKRTSHLSSMIVSGQMSREEALKELEEPLYDPAVMDEYISIIKSHMGVTDEEFDSAMNAPIHQHDFYKTEDDTIHYKVIIALSNFQKKIVRKG